MITTLAKIATIAPLSAAIIGAFATMGSGALAAADPLPYGSNTCAQGFVWRAAGPSDQICVTPDARTQAAGQNGLAAQNRDPNAGAYGNDTCKQGFVWRDAFSGDHVCVTAGDRAQAASDNAAAASHLATSAPAQTPPLTTRDLPADSSCRQFGFNGPFVIKGEPDSSGDSHWTVNFTADGPDTGAPDATVVFASGEKVTGHVLDTSGIETGSRFSDPRLHLKIQWDNKPNNVWVFEGKINAKGLAYGRENLQDGNLGARWNVSAPLDCLDA